MALVIKNPSANEGDVRDTGLIPGLGRFPAGGHGNPPQYSCLENPTDRGAQRSTVHRSNTSVEVFEKPWQINAWAFVTPVGSAFCPVSWFSLVVPIPDACGPGWHAPG